MARSGKKAASDNKNKEKQDARSVSAANFLMQEFKQDEAEAYKFLQTFINGMDRKTPLAYHLAQLIENDDVFQYTLAKRFPAERGAYNETLQEYEKKIEPLKEKRADLRRELEELNEEYGVESASSDDDKTDDDDADLSPSKGQGTLLCLTLVSLILSLSLFLDGGDHDDDHDADHDVLFFTLAKNGRD